MNRIVPTIGRLSCRSSCFRPQSTAAASALRLERLTGRSLIRVHGEQSSEFLQSLITNDIRHLDPSNSQLQQPISQSAIYTLFLNKAGRVLYDAIVYRPNANEPTFLIECDRDCDADLQRHLKIFRVRKKIDIDVIGRERAVWVAFRPSDHEAETTNDALTKLPGTDALAFRDPRLRNLGTRLLLPADASDVSALLPDATVCPPDADEHRLLRYRLGIAEGLDELPHSKCFPLESNADYLHGVSFHKGCYLGQEFTARTHHTGVVRKRLLPVRFVDGRQLSAKCSRNVESTNGMQLGKVRGFSGDSAVALLKYEPALGEEAALVFGGNGQDSVLGRPMRPFWWPTEAPSSVRK